MGYCSTHGVYIDLTVPGCSKCAYDVANQKPIILSRVEFPCPSCAEKDARIRELEEQLRNENSVDEYIIKRSDEVHAVAEKHWQSYWDELGKRKAIESRAGDVEQLRALMILAWENRQSFLDAARAVSAYLLGKEGK